MSDVRLGSCEKAQTRTRTLGLAEVACCTFAEVTITSSPYIQLARAAPGAVFLLPYTTPIIGGPDCLLLSAQNGATLYSHSTNEAIAASCFRRCRQCCMYSSSLSRTSHIQRHRSPIASFASLAQLQIRTETTSAPERDSVPFRLHCRSLDSTI